MSEHNLHDISALDAEASLCGCGTVADAVRAAERLLIQTSAANCHIWTYAVACALQQMAVEHLLRGGAPAEYVAVTATRIQLTTAMEAMPAGGK